MAVVNVIKKGNSLVPADADAAAILARVKEGREMMITARAPRSPRQHRFFWHMCRLICENTDEYKTPENVADTIKIGTGHYDTRILKIPGWPEDVVQYVAKSIAFESMPNIEFQQFMDKAMDYVAQYMLAGVSVETIRREIEAKMLSP